MSRELRDSIIKGELDNDLETIANAINDRRKWLQNVKASSIMMVITVGTRCRLKGLSPDYMNGREVVVVEKRRTRVQVRLDGPVGRFSRGIVNVPANCLEPIT